MIKSLKTSALTLSSLSVTFPNGNGGLQALRDISFEVKPQEFLCVLGPSGCGKTTLLRVLAGLLQPSSGIITFHEHSGKLPETGFVFQNANLMPWRNVMQNITLPLELSKTPPDEIREKAVDLIDLVGLQGFEGNWPKDLSGGMAQRVALARALIHDPDLLLLDEPFGALDALTRERMGTELLRIWQARQKTVVMVTHSISEAVFLADRVLVLSSRPGTVSLDLKIDLPRPRAEEMRYSDLFGKLARKIKGAIEG
jgi:NitT/TauT family transport system ATP-binding protein